MAGDVDLVLSASLDQFVAGLNEATGKLTGALDQMRTTAQSKSSEIDQAFAKLGLKRFSDIQAEVNEVRAAFNRLKDSGELTGAALVQAQVRTEESVRSLFAQTNGWADSLDKVKIQALAAVASLAAVGRVLGDAGGAAADFGQKMAEVSTQLDDTSVLPQLTDQVRDLAREMGGDAVANAQGLYDILSAGVSDPVAAMERLTVANKLAVGGVTDVTIAAGGLNAVLNSYGEAAGNATDVADAFFVAAREGATSVAELAQNIGGVAPLASQAGVSFDELIASVTSLTNGGVKTAEAFTQVQSILSAVVKPTNEASKLAEELGIQFDVAAIKSKGLAGFLADVKEKTGGSAEQMAVLFGRIEGLNGALSLTGSQADSFAGTIDALKDKAGAAEKAFKTLSETDAFKIQEFNSALKDVQLTLGTAVTALTPVLQGVTYLLNGFNDLPEPIRLVVAALGGLVAVIAPLALAWTALSGPMSLLAATVLPRLGALFGTVGAAAAAAATGAVAFGLGVAPLAAIVGGLTIAAQAGADALVEYALAQQQIGFDEARRAQLQEEIVARQAQADALKQYADVAVLSAEQVAALGETERASYEERLAGAKAYESATTGVLVRQRELTGATEANTAANIANSARQKELNAGLAAFAEGARLGAAAAEAGLTPAAQKLADKLLAASTESKTAADELKTLFESVNGGMPAGDIDTLVRGLAEVVGGSNAASMTLRDELGPALRDLTGTQLVTLGDAAKAAFESGSGSAEGMALVLDGVVAESLRSLGANAGLMGEQFTAAGRETLDAFSAIAKSGRASAEQVMGAFNLALKRLSTPEEINALLEQLKKVGPTAGISMAQMEQAARAAAGALNKVEGAQAGVNEEILRSNIRKLEDEYTKLIKSGKATAEELAKVRDELALLNKQMQGLGTDAQGAGNDLQNAGDDAADAGSSMNDMGSDAQDAGENLQDVSAAANSIADALNEVDMAAQGMSDSFKESAVQASNAAHGYTEYIAIWKGFNDAFADQKKIFDNRLAISEKTVASMDEEQQALERLRRQYSAISDDELRKLLDSERKAKELREKSTEATNKRTDAERELRKEIEQTNTSTGGTATVVRHIELVLKITNAQSGGAAPLSLTQAQIREIADRVIAEIKRDQNL